MFFGEGVGRRAHRAVRPFNLSFSSPEKMLEKAKKRFYTLTLNFNTQPRYYFIYLFHADCNILS